MIDWDGGESPVYTRPAILATSRGAVVFIKTTTLHQLQVQGGSSAQQLHNPAGDEITVSIDNVAS